MILQKREVSKKEDEFRALLKEAGDKLVVVDFSATWCGPCKKIAPEYEVKAHLSVVNLTLPLFSLQDVSTDCGISCMPTFHFYKNGKKVDEFSGANLTTLIEKLEKLRS
uniref:Thioredoxin n=1 Tax=Mastacembelus armatus TaxID=205130 RepID=A0A7N8WWT0_9TELE